MSDAAARAREIVEGCSHVGHSLGDTPGACAVCIARALADADTTIKLQQAALDVWKKAHPHEQSPGACARALADAEQRAQRAEALVAEIGLKALSADDPHKTDIVGYVRGLERHLADARRALERVWSEAADILVKWSNNLCDEGRAEQTSVAVYAGEGVAPIPPTTVGGEAKLYAAEMLANVSLVLRKRGAALATPPGNESV